MPLPQSPGIALGSSNSLHVLRTLIDLMTLSYFASGTGAAGLVGAFLWWEVRSLGVRIGVGISSVRPTLLFPRLSLTFQLQVLPIIIPITYFFLLPSPLTFLSFPSDTSALLSPPAGEYTPIATVEDELLGEEEGTLSPGPKRGVALSLADKWRLVKPLLGKYMLPLCESVC